MSCHWCVSQCLCLYSLLLAVGEQCGGKPQCAGRPDSAGVREGSGAAQRLGQQCPLLPASQDQQQRLQGRTLRQRVGDTLIHRNFYTLL